MIGILQKLLKSDNSDIGFSLGAQFVGALGLAMDKKMTRITGLDPAGPEFFLYPPDQRLSEDDAELVDVIHTATPALITVRILIIT